MWEIVPFEKKYKRSDFDCGNSGLNEYLKRYISQDLKRGLTKAYVAIPEGDDKIIGYYTVSSARVGCHEVPGKWKSKVGVYPVPCSLIGRLAVDGKVRGQGLGEDLLMHAYHTVKKASRHIGIKAIIVDAEDTNAEAFYKKYGFEYLDRSLTSERKTLFIELDEALKD
jgi:GNAT superfamily N-acetyltransferase